MKKNTVHYFDSSTFLLASSFLAQKLPNRNTRTDGTQNNSR